MMQNDTIKTRAVMYLYKSLKKARFRLWRAEEKQNSTEEITNLKNKIEVLEWLADVVTDAQNLNDF